MMKHSSYDTDINRMIDMHACNYCVYRPQIHVHRLWISHYQNAFTFITMIPFQLQQELGDIKWFLASQMVVTQFYHGQF